MRLFFNMLMPLGMKDFILTSSVVLILQAFFYFSILLFSKHIDKKVNEKDILYFTTNGKPE